MISIVSMGVVAAIHFPAESWVCWANVGFICHHDLVIAQQVTVHLMGRCNITSTGCLEFDKLRKSFGLDLFKMLSCILVVYWWHGQRHECLTSVIRAHLARTSRGLCRCKPMSNYQDFHLRSASQRPLVALDRTDPATDFDFLEAAAFSAHSCLFSGSCDRASYVSF
jgi:hypothetical protein